MKPTHFSRYSAAKQVSRPLLLMASLSLGLLLSGTAPAEKGAAVPSPAHPGGHHAMHEGHGHDMAHDHASHQGGDGHDAHRAMLNAQHGYVRSTSHYPIPDIQLLGADGQPVQLQALLNADRPVILNFIFTSCTTVCPILSATLSQTSKAFEEDAIKPLMVSISIDPEYDTPERLREYADRYHAGEDWHFLTGDPATVVALQRAFHTYYGNKLNHQPVSFLRPGPEHPWLRLQGFTTSAELVSEYRALLDHRS